MTVGFTLLPLLSWSYYSEKFIVCLVTSSSEHRPEQKGKCHVSALGRLTTDPAYLVSVAFPFFLAATGFLLGCCHPPSSVLSQDLEPVTR